MVLVPAMYLFNGQKPTSEELFLSYYEPYDELITTRGNVDSLNLLLIDGMEAYNQGAYQECSDLLASYLEVNPEAYKVFLYLAIAQLELNLQEQAEVNFLKAQEDPVFKQQAEWYQALSYLKFSETQKAIVVLESIVNSKNHYRKNEAGSSSKGFKLILHSGDQASHSSREIKRYYTMTSPPGKWCALFSHWIKVIFFYSRLTWPWVRLQTTSFVLLHTFTAKE